MKKKVGILALLLSSAMVISAGALIKINGRVNAYAQDGKIDAVELFTAESGVVAKKVDGNDGVEISNAGGNVGVFNGVFSGDFEMEYAYSAPAWGATEFTFYDKDAPETKVFSVYRSVNYDSKGTAFVVDYVNGKYMYLGTSVDNTTPVDQYFAFSVANSDDKKEIYPNNVENISIVGKLGLFFTGNSVDVKVSQGWDKEITTYLTLATLTLDDFSDGYILKIHKSTIFRAGEDNSVLITSINGNAITEGKIQASATYSGISYPGEYKHEDKNVIDLPYRASLKEFVCSGNLLLSSTGFGQFVGAQTLTEFNVSDDHHTKEIGTYDLTVNYGEIKKDYVINVVDGATVNKSDLFTESSNAVVNQNGIAVDTADGNVGVFNGVFSGDFETEYSYTKRSYGEIEFGFYDKDAPDTKVFSVYRSFKDGDVGTAFVIDCATGMGTAFGENVILTAMNQWNIDHFNSAYKVEAYPNNAGHYDTVGKLGVYFIGDTVSIKVTQGWDGVVTDYVTLHTMTKENLSDGYIVKINATEYFRTTEKDSVLIHSVNGVKLDTDQIACTATEGTISYPEEEAGVINIEQGTELGNFTVTYKGTISGSSKLGTFNGTFSSEFALNEKYATKAVGEYEEVVEKFGANKTYTINVNFYILTPTLIDGAQVRIASDMEGSGIRFVGKIDKEEFDALTELATEVKVGLIIVPFDYLNDIDFTLEALETAGKKYVKLDCTKKMYIGEGNAYYINGALVGILANNYDRRFASIAYIEGKIGAESFIKYGEFDPQKNVRSIVEVAKKAYEDREDGVSVYSDLQLSLLKNYIDAVVDVNIDEAGNVTYNNHSTYYTSAYTVEYNAGTITVNSSSDIFVILVNGVRKTGFTCLQSGDRYVVSEFSI